LETAAYAQQRHPLRQTGAHQRQRERVAHGVQRQRGVVHVFLEVFRVHVGGRAGEQHAIDLRQQLAHLRRLGQREQHRLRLRADLDRTRVLVAQQQIGHVVGAQQAVVGGQPDQGRGGGRRRGGRGSGVRVHGAR